MGAFTAPGLRRAGADDWAQLARFCAVGGSGWIVNLVVFTGLLAAGAHHLVAAVGAFAVAWSSNFILNRLWTFRRPGSAVVQGTRHLAVSLTGLGANLVLLHTLVTAGLPPVGSQALAILLIAPVAFLANRRWAFR